MADTGATIWHFLKGKGFSDYAAAGIMGNLQAESGLKPNNLQNSYEKKLGFTDATYTQAVDSGSYTSFANDKAGYGLAQWTYHTRKQNLLNYAKQLNCSIANLDMQLNYLYIELSNNSVVKKGLASAKSVREASDVILTKFERPANQSEANKARRAKLSQAFYDTYASNKKSEVNTVGAAIITGFINDRINGIAVNTSRKCNAGNYEACSARDISYIVMHYTGNKKDTALNNAKYFQTAGRNASAHFFVDDNNIYQSVALNNKAWHCGTNKQYYHNCCRNANSIGIEMCTNGSYKVSEKTKENAIALCAYLCKKHGIVSANVDKYVLRHYDVTHKNCPAQMAGANNAEWQAFLSAVKSKLSGTASTQQSTSTATVNAFSPTGTAKATANLRMRAGAGTTYNTLLTVKKGCIVEIDGTLANGWYHCRYNNVIGYMSGAYLKDIETTSSTATATKTHKVVKGDTLSAIAKKYGTTVNAIVIANRSKYPQITANNIVVGWELIV